MRAVDATLAILLAACAASEPKRAAPPTAEPPAARIDPRDHEAKRGDLYQFLPIHTTTAWFLDVANTPPGPLFDRALAQVCPSFCETMATYKRGDLRAVVDRVMVIGAGGQHPQHIVVVVDPHVRFGLDFLGPEHRRQYRGVEIATWDHDPKPIDVALVHGYLLFSIDGGLEPFIERALAPDSPRSHFDEVLAESVHDTQFWLLFDDEAAAFNVAANLRSPVEAEVRLVFADEAGARRWYQQLDALDPAMWSALGLPEVGRTFDRYQRGRVAGVTAAPTLDEALCLTRDGVLARMAANQGLGRCP